MYLDLSNKRSIYVGGTTKVVVIWNITVILCAKIQKCIPNKKSDVTF